MPYLQILLFQLGSCSTVTLTTANHIAALDISDLNNVKRLDNPDEDQPSIGPHYISECPCFPKLIAPHPQPFSLVQLFTYHPKYIFLTEALKTEVTPDQKHIVVTDYFVQTGDIGIVNTPADFKALYIDIAPNGGLNFNRSIDFQREFGNRGGAKPHSAVVFDLTDPAKPYYY